MIAVQFNKRDFEYDIHSLIRAFYPGMEVSIYCRGETEPEAELFVDVDYLEDAIEVSLCDKGRAPVSRRSVALHGQN